MPNITTSVIRLSNFPPTIPNVPPNYPISPTPGKIQLLLNSNDNYLYHKFTPFTNYHDSLLSGVLSNRQPFVYTFIDEAQNSKFNQLPASVKGLAQISNITPGTINDVVRVSKFLISSWGVQFLITQAAIQRTAPFDETRIYNPLSPVLATVAPLTLGIGNMPTRHIEGGILGLVNSVTSTVGINLQSGFQTPASTAGFTALPSENTGQGKGLVRGGDAGKGYVQIQMKWPVSAPSSNSGGLSSGISSMFSAMANAAGQMFGATRVRQPAGTQVRADESTYGYMATSYKLNLKQQWYPSLKVTIAPDGGPLSTPSPLIKLNTQITSLASDITSFVTNPIGSSIGLIASLLGPSVGGSKSVKRIKFIMQPNGKLIPKSDDSGLTGLTITGKISGVPVSSPTGYTISDGDKYGSNVGKPADDFSLTNSDILVQYSYYLDDAQNFPSKFSDPDRAIKLNNELQKAIDKINLAPTYIAFKSPASYLLPSAGNGATYVKYDSWSAKQQTAQKIGASGEYDNGSGVAGQRPKTIDSFVSKNSLRMATSFMSDGINTLGVLGKNRKINSKNSNVSDAYRQGWVEWKPYEDDLVAFFFYDVVNEKYIPFRATVKAISEGNTAFWDELRFIGRADQLYSYNGFSRTLSFTFNVVINSVTELLPSWKKINYIASAVKPSNYTSTNNGMREKFNRFIVPPMFMLTIGDLYKFQPMVITSININVPDDAVWETLNESNSDNWNYLNGLITSNTVGKKYGQLPREVEIAVTCNLLEKERAIVGGSHFGHEPRVDDWETTLDSDGNPTGDTFLSSGSVDIPYLPSPSVLHQGFVEWNNPGTPSTLTIEKARAAAVAAAQPTVAPPPTSTPTTTALILSPAQKQNMVEFLSKNPAALNRVKAAVSTNK